MSVLFASIHHWAFLALFGSLLCEWWLLKSEHTIANARKLMVADGVYGISAGVLLVVGLCRVYFFEKGAAYYWSNHAFVAKLTLFVVIGIISIGPTREFLSWRKPLKQGVLPACNERRRLQLARVVHIELALLSIIPVLAALMAKAWR
jgi:putative membrane protein